MLKRVISKMRFIARLFAGVSTLSLFAILVDNASADQFVGRHHGREVVVHSNPIPVFLHRLVPPNYGRHVTIREYQVSRRNERPTTTSSSNPSLQDKSKP